jgi:hypothetical protein
MALGNLSTAPRNPHPVGGAKGRRVKLTHHPLKRRPAARPRPVEFASNFNGF